MGRRVEKHFNEFGTYQGMVTDQHGQECTVVYDDGEEEQLSQDEVKELLLPWTEYYEAMETFQGKIIKFKGGFLKKRKAKQAFDMVKVLCEWDDCHHPPGDPGKQEELILKKSLYDWPNTDGWLFGKDTAPEGGDDDPANDEHELEQAQEMDLDDEDEDEDDEDADSGRRDPRDTNPRPCKMPRNKYDNDISGGSDLETD